MRAVICVLLVVGLILPSVAACGSRGLARQGNGGGSSRQMGAACVDSGLVVKGSSGDSSSVEMSSDEGFWLQVVRVVLTAIRDGVVYDVVKTVVKRVWERPPTPVRTPGWGETGCGMGAAGGSRY